MHAFTMLGNGATYAVLAINGFRTGTRFGVCALVAIETDSVIQMNKMPLLCALTHILNSRFEYTNYHVSAEGTLE